MIAANPELGQTVDVGGARVNYLTAGSGAPVILLHGSGPGVTGYANWRLLMPRLSPHCHVIAPDVVGFGYTERPPQFDYSLDGWTGFLCGFMDALGIERADFVGNSFGGGLTLAMAARHPARVRRMVMMGAAGLEFELTPGLDAVWGYEPSPAAMRGLMSLFAYDQSLIKDDLVQSRYEASIRPGYQEAYSQLFPAPRGRHIKRLATPEDDIRRIAQPALIVHGREDRIVPVESSIRLHQLLKHSELHVFGECGHWTQVEKAGPFGDLVEQFLRRA